MIDSGAMNWPAAPSATALTHHLELFEPFSRNDHRKSLPSTPFESLDCGASVPECIVSSDVVCSGRCNDIFPLTFCHAFQHSGVRVWLIVVIIQASIMTVNSKGRKELTLNERKAGFAMLVMACKDGELPKGSFVRAAAAFQDAQRNSVEL